MKWWKVLGLVVLALVLVGLTTQVARFLGSRTQADQRQEALDPFYTPPDPLPSTKPGTLLRSEPLGATLTGASTFRILYVSQKADGSPTVSSGMLLIPDSPAPAGGRPVVAWAHPTVGLGDACAPSRRDEPISSQLTEPWMLQMISFGYVIVATDYAGLGTPGISQYLVGQAEANDVVNSVRAAREFKDSGASTTWMVYGHSQGGQSALWTGDLANKLAPELNLVAVAAAAPAAELVPLVDEQWDETVSWVIGPEVAYGWPTQYPNLPLSAVIAQEQINSTESLATDCLKAAALGGLVRQNIGRTYFSSNPIDNPQWKAALTAQTPAPITDLPVLIIQGTADQVVIPNTTSLLEQKWCAAGSNLTSVWLGGQGHNHMGEMGGTVAGSWFQRILAGEKISNTCSQPPTVLPYPTPVNPGFGSAL
ncbi:MAG: lipase family protein [Actinomycetes bacterium]